MSNVIYNNFTAGLVTPKLAGNYSSQLYHNGCAELENFSVMLQGGITRRPPLESAFTATGTRIIPFIIDVDTVYMVELGFVTGQSYGFFKMWHKSGNSWVAGTGYEGNTPYTDVTHIQDIQFAQSADVLYLAEEHHTPQKLHYDGTSLKWEMADVNAVLTTYDDGGTTREWDPMDDGGTNGLFKDSDDHPRVVGFFANRLWFASSPKHPNRYWASMPFDHEYFKFYTIVKVVDQTTTAAAMMTAISTDTYSSTSTYDVGDQVTRFGLIYQCTTAITTAEEWDIDHWEYVGELAIDGQVTYVNKPTVTEDNGIRFDACGNDSVRWISAKNNILVGTASGEYAIPGNVNGLNYQLSDLSSYGSMKGAQAIQANGEVIFPQSGGRRIRSEIHSSEGYSCLDLTYQCDRILADHGGVVRMAWRRVPDPALFVVLGDGTVAVLFYERGYGLCAWAHWSFLKATTGTDLAQVKDVCVLDNPNGQDVYFLVQRGSALAVEHLMTLDASDSFNTSYKDLGTIPFTSHMKTNPYEANSRNYGSSLGKKKRISSITCRVYRTKAFTAGYGEKYMKEYQGDVLLSDREILLPGGYGDFVQMTVESVEDKPLTLLAFSLDLEAEK